MTDPTLPILEPQKEKARSDRLQSSLKDLLDLTRRRKWLIISCVLLGVAVGGGLALLKKDVYRSSAVIVVERPSRPDESVSTPIHGDVAERVSTLTQRLLSRTHLRKVIDEFLLSPDMVKRRGYEPVIQRLRNTIVIETKSGRRQLEALTLSFAHQDPMTAMKVTSTLASHYINDNSKQQESIIDGPNEFLQRELDMAKHALEEKELELNEYQRKFLRELPGQLETNLRGLDRLQFEKIRIQESLNGLNSRLALVRKSMINYESSSPRLQEAMIGEGGDFSVAELAQLKHALDQMVSESSEDNPGQKFLKRQIEKLEAESARRRSPGAEVERAASDPYLGELRNEREDLTTQIANLKSQLQKIAVSMSTFERHIQRTPERGQVLSALERNYTLLKERYQHLQQKRINARLSEDRQNHRNHDQFRIMDPANLPTIPEGWPREFFALGGLASGLGLGFGLAVLLDVFFPTFRRSVDVELSLGFPLLATIPRFQMAYDKPMNMLTGVVESPLMMNGKTGGETMRDYVDLEGMGKGKTVFYGKPSTNHHFPAQLNLVSRWRPHSLVAEQFRVAATRLDLLGDRAMGNVVLVSSAMQGEGKTSMAANLAYTLAQDLDESTLIIDCDYKRPYLHNVLALRSSPGVADYLAGQDSLESCFQQYSEIPLWCLAVGDIEKNPVSLAKLQYLSTLIESIRSRYRFIILDGPPILPLADINVLSRLADIVLMVVRSGTTPKDVVQRASEMLNTSCLTRMILTDAWSEGIPNYVRPSYSKPKALSSQI